MADVTDHTATRGTTPNKIQLDVILGLKMPQSFQNVEYTPISQRDIIGNFIIGKAPSNFGNFSSRSGITPISKIMLFFKSHDLFSHWCHFSRMELVEMVKTLAQVF